METKKPYLCIYHGNCADGFTAAWVVRNALGEGNVDFKPGFYGKYDESLWDNLASLSYYDVIYLVDFSYKRDHILILAEWAKKIVIIDHHKTAKEDLVELPANVEVHFDMDHSGAMLTWMYFTRLEAEMSGCSSNWNEDRAELAPALIQRVEDRDLWRFRFSDTRTVQANIFSYEYTFENWDKLAAEHVEDLAAGGEAIERKHFKDIKELLAAGTSRMIINGYNVPCANLPYIHSSDAGHMMGVGEKFAACYWITGEKCTFSLRSAEDGIDVSEVAKSFGGGGHKHAAGFEINLAYQQGFIVFPWEMQAHGY